MHRWIVMFSGALFLWLASGLALSVGAQCAENFFSINSVEAANIIRDCTTLTGQVLVDLSNASGTFRLDSVQRIVGNLVIQNYGIDLNTSNTDHELLPTVELSMRSLEEVTGRLEASNVPNLVSISFPTLARVLQLLYLHHLPKLTTVDLPILNKVGAFILNTLPRLRKLELDAGISEITGYQDSSFSPYVTVDPYVVVEGTALAKLESFNFSTVAIFQITNNWNLESISMPLRETKRPKAWTLTTNEISGNGDSNTTLSLPLLFKLDTELTEFHDLSRIDIPRLQKVEGSLLIGDNERLETFNATMLKEISNDLTIEWNPNLSEITFPVLKTVNFLVAQGTKALEKPDGLSTPGIHAVTEAYIGGDGSKVDCQLWDNKRCTGLVTKVYSCGSNWRHHRKIDIARDPEECRFIHPSHGWTRAKKIRVCTRFVVAVAILIAALYTCLHYRHSLRNVFRGTSRGEYTRAEDEDEESVEFDVRDVERGNRLQDTLRDKPLPDKPLPDKPKFDFGGEMELKEQGSGQEPG